MPRNRKSFDFDFSSISNEKEAYIYGFFVADGHNSIKNGYIRIELQRKDADILRKIRDTIRRKERIRFYNRCGKTYARLSINGVVLCENLFNLGVGNNKTKEIQNLHIPYKFFWSFLRGLTDGDGTIYINEKNRRVSWHLNAHEHLVEIIKKEVLRLTGLNICICNHHRTPYIKRLSIEGTKCVNLFLRYLYKNSDIHLNRKYNKYLQIIKLFEKYRRDCKGKGLVKYRGVRKRGKIWESSIFHHGKSHYIGSFKDPKEAAKAFDNEALRVHGEKATLNFSINNP